MLRVIKVQSGKTYKKQTSLFFFLKSLETLLSVIFFLKKEKETKKKMKEFFLSNKITSYKFVIYFVFLMQ